MPDKGKNKQQKPVREFQSCLYMLPVSADVKQLVQALPFVPKEAIEIWTEVNILEVTLENGTLTLEDMMQDISGTEDTELLAELKVQQVYACDYETADKKAVQRILQSLIEQFGGFLGSDTEDFQPFIKVEEL